MNNLWGANDFTHKFKVKALTGSIREPSINISKAII